jgi:uncharacterized protein (DUF58 family)
MSEIMVLLLVVLIAVAAVTRETFVLVLGYLLVGTYLFGRWWSHHSLKSVKISRVFTDHVFPGETIPVEIELANRSWLPVIWLGIRDLHPVYLSEIRSFKQVTSLSSRRKQVLNYHLKATRRGLYSLGPMTIETGDLFGWIDQVQSEFPAEYLTVYPKIIPLRHPNLPSTSPMGSLRYRQPMFEDPSRPVGKRDYQPGDPLKRVDWKSSASSARLQVKVFEPSIDLEVSLFLNMNSAEYHGKSRFDGPELAVVTAASLASWAVGNRQSVGLVTNGLDQLKVGEDIQPVQPHKGQAHLMRMLEALARVKSSAEGTQPIIEMIRRYRHTLGWGTTLVAITGSADEDLMRELLLTRKFGLNPFLIVCGWYVEVNIPVQRGKAYGVPIRIFHSEDDLKVWQL